MTSNDKVRITLRIPKSLNDLIKSEANKIGISVNAYITTVLSKEINENGGIVKC